MKRYLKYTVKGLTILLGILVLIYILAYIYVVINKKEIIEQVRHKISEELTGDVKIGDVDISYLRTFPRISVLLENVSITDTLFAQHNHPFFKAERLFAQINIIRLIQKKDPLSGIRIDNGQLYVYTDTSGYTNSYLFSGKKKIADPATPNKDKSIIKDITLRNVRLIMDNKQKAKLYDFDVNKMDCDIKTTDSVLYIKTKNKILVHNLAFNLDKGSFGEETLLEGNIDVQYSKSRQQLSFTNTTISLKGHPFVFTGNFNLGPAKNFILKISATNVKYDFARSMLPKKISANLSKFKSDQPVDEVTADISGPLNGGEPLVKIGWRSGPIDVQTPFFDVENASFTGSYTNELVPGLPRNDRNSRVQFHNVKGEWEGIGFTSQNVYIDDFIDPVMNCDIKSDFKLSAINNMLNSKTIKLNEGKASLNLSYSGPLQENTRKNTFINGKVIIQNGLISYRPRNIDLRDCNFNIVFKNSDVLVTDFRTNMQGNRVEMNGRANNLLSLIKTNPGKISLDWYVHSPSLNLEAFTVLLKKRNKVASVSTGTGKLYKLANRIDNLLEQANIRVDLKADKLEYKKFTASNVIASLGLFEDSYNLNKVSLQHAGGMMQITGSLRGANEYYQEAKVKVNMENVDINKVLYAFNNFGQDALKSDNIQGKFTSTIDVRMDIDRQLKKTPANIQGFLDFSLKNGALINFEPIQKLQNFLFKNRDFKDIRFAELKDRLELKDRDIKINRMEIQSTALSMFVEGVYSLKGNTDISIQVPLSNLKKRSVDYNPENLGADAKGGTSVFVRGQPGADGNIKFKYDMFKKFRKADKKSE